MRRRMRRRRKVLRGAVTENRENVKRDKKRVTWSNEVSRFFYGDSQLTGPAAKRARTPATAVRRLRDLQEGRKTRRKGFQYHDVFMPSHIRAWRLTQNSLSTWIESCNVALPEKKNKESRRQRQNKQQALPRRPAR